MMRKIILFFLLASAVMSALFGSYFAIRDLLFLKNGKQTIATVISYRQFPPLDPDSLNDVMYAPVFSFTDERGTSHTVISNVRSNNVSSETGQTIRIVYDPQQPDQATILQTLWIAPLILFCLSAAGFVAWFVFKHFWKA